MDVLDYERFKDVVDGYYEFMDEQIGLVLDGVGEEWAVMLVSDHGFRIGDERPKSVATLDIRGAHLDHAPEGVFIAHGPGFRRNTWVNEGASVLDVTPTLLHYLGLPVAKDMDGRVLDELLEPAFMGTRPIRYIASYENGTAAEPAAAVGRDEGFATEEAMEHMRALGYVGGDSRESSEIEQKPSESLTSPEQHLNMGRIHLDKGELGALGLPARVGGSARQRGGADEHRPRPPRPQRHPSRPADEAKKVYAKALELVPGDPRVLNNVGDLLLREGKTDVALDHFRRAALSSPAHVESRFNIGSVLLRDGKSWEAIPWLKEAADLRSDVELIQNRLALAYLESGEVEEAKRRYEMLTRLFPLSHVACLQLARIASRDGDDELSAAWLRHAWKPAGPPIKADILRDPDFKRMDLDAVFD